MSTVSQPNDLGESSITGAHGGQMATLAASEITDNSLKGELSSLQSHFLAHNDLSKRLADAEGLLTSIRDSHKSQVQEHISGMLTEKQNLLDKAASHYNIILKTSPPERLKKFHAALEGIDEKKSSTFLGELTSHLKLKNNIDDQIREGVLNIRELAKGIPPEPLPLRYIPNPPAAHSWFVKNVKAPVQNFVHKKRNDFSQVMSEIDQGGMVGYFRMIIAFTAAQIGIGALINVFKGPEKTPEEKAAETAQIITATTPPPASKSNPGEGQGGGPATAVQTSAITAADMQVIENKKNNKPAVNWGKQIAFRAGNLAVVAGAVFGINKLMFTPKGRPGGHGL